MEGQETEQQPQETQTTPEAQATEAAPHSEQGQGQETAQGTPKSYNEKQVAEIVSKRVNELNQRWGKFGKPEDLEQKLARLQAFEQAAGGTKQAQTPPESEADKQVREYLSKMGYVSKTELQQVQQAVGMVMQQRAMEVTTNNQNALRGELGKAGYPKEQHEMIENLVANSIRGNPKDMAEYQRTGSFEIVKRHFDELHKSFGALATAKTAAYAKDKSKEAGLAPRMPAAGVPAPTSKTKTLGDAERIAAAWKKLNEPPAA